MSATEFSGVPLVAGSVVGVRAFDVDGLMRLRGVSHDQVWTPGENVAECKIRVISREQAETEREHYTETRVTYSTGGMAFYHRPSAYRLEDAPHSIDSCSCGFYAYYSGSNDYASTERVQAVIEGWGETAIGTRGFRTSKAKVLALCVPGAEQGPEPETPHRKWRDSTVGEAFRWLRHRAGYVGAAVTLPGLVVNAISGSYLWVGILSFLFAANVAMEIAHAKQRRKPTMASRFATGGLIPKPPTSAPVDVAKLRRNYPDVPIFSNYEQMLAEFPTSRGEEPTPDSDPDFWTRPL